MELLLERKTKTAKSTIGTLSIDGKFECYTLEDIARPVKIKKETSIPTGRYQVVITFSNRFQKMMPLLVNVPKFEGIRIHPGNTAHDTWGCILVGQTQGQDTIYNSRPAYAALFQKLQAANKKEKIFITIK